MIEDTGMNPVTSRPERGPRWQTWRIGNVAVVEPNPLSGDPIHIRRCVTVITITAQMVRPLRIDVQIQNTHRLILSCF